jgi:hypothetical protein
MENRLLGKKFLKTHLMARCVQEVEMKALLIELILEREYSAGD